MNDMSAAPQLWARKDEPVTCVQGHVICHVSRDITIGEGRLRGDFYRWEQTPPGPKERVPKIRCWRCKGVWVRGTRGRGFQFHFKEGWR